MEQLRGRVMPSETSVEFVVSRLSKEIRGCLCGHIQLVCSWIDNVALFQRRLKSPEGAGDE